ncbi:hypothetical protein [Corynebacterium renale]|uniref:Secreted protein n=1 Tax=Corynebacterium renale TaxID=1724 RepID=A0A2A9DPV4_9CORY|nr:hypothetical protein [Corynebacterium renale]PFG27950.1 hypothetical protein ATK06_1032 [Corynebacterium renale]SQI21570.1 putative secreted protein [Corynebacterium renale]
MRAFTKGALAITAAAAVTTGVCAPAANAMSVKVDGQVCTFTIPESEKHIFEMENGTWTLTPNEAQGYIAGGLAYIDSYESLLAENEAKRKAGTISEFDYHDAKVRAEQVNKYYGGMMPALRACVEGKDLSQTSSEAQVALSSADGKGLTPAGIGVTVAGAVAAVLGLLVAALPQIKPLLPAQIANLLP